MNNGNGAEFSRSNESKPTRDDLLRGVERQAKIIHDLRVYFRGFTHGGGKLGIEIEPKDVEEALGFAEIALQDYVRKTERDLKKKSSSTTS